MYIYLFVVILVVLFSKYINDKKFSLYDITIILALGLICGLRYKVGSDYFLYEGAYYDLNEYNRMEYGIMYLIKFLNFLHLDYSVFLLIISFLTISFVYISLKKYSKTPHQSLFLFICLGYYAMCFNGIRQMLALSICLISIKYLLNRKILKYLICIFCACLCHFTAIIMIPLYFIVNINFDKKILKIFLIISVLLYFAYEPLLYCFTHTFKQYMIYYKKTNMTYWEPGLGTYILGSLRLILAIVIIKYKNMLVEKNSNNNFFINLFLISIPFYAFSFENALLSRYTYYFSIYEIFLIPQLLEIIVKDRNRKIMFIIPLLFIVYYIIHLYSFNSMLPYNWIL